MSKSDKKTAEESGIESLEYIGTSGRIFRDLPVMKTGAFVKVPSGRVKALLATGKFKKSTPKAVKNAAKEN